MHARKTVGDGMDKVIDISELTLLSSPGPIAFPPFVMMMMMMMMMMMCRAHEDCTVMLTMARLG